MGTLGIKYTGEKFNQNNNNKCSQCISILVLIRNFIWFYLSNTRVRSIVRWYNEQKIAKCAVLILYVSVCVCWWRRRRKTVSVIIILSSFVSIAETNYLLFTNTLENGDGDDTINVSRFIISSFMFWLLMCVLLENDLIVNDFSRINEKWVVSQKPWFEGKTTY